MDLSELITSRANNVTIAIKTSDLLEIIDHICDARDKKALKKAQEAMKDRVPSIPAAQAAEMLGVSRETLRRWARMKYLVPVKIGIKPMYCPSDINRMLKINKK